MVLNIENIKSELENIFGCEDGERRICVEDYEIEIDGEIVLVNAVLDKQYRHYGKYFEPDFDGYKVVEIEVYVYDEDMNDYRKAA